MPKSLIRYVPATPNPDATFHNGDIVRFRPGTRPKVMFLDFVVDGEELPDNTGPERRWYVNLVLAEDVGLPPSRQRGRAGWVEELQLRPTFASGDRVLSPSGRIMHLTSDPLIDGEVVARDGVTPIAYVWVVWHLDNFGAMHQAFPVHELRPAPDEPDASALVVDALERNMHRDYSPTAISRMTGLTTEEVLRVLPALVRARTVYSTNRGALSRYQYVG
jgi:hypothetical protein